MANKEALRELQSRLAEKLKVARTQERGKSWLAVECGGHGFLFPLQEAGEIFPFAPAMPVPYTSRWFLGVANLRGRLHGVVDLAGFLGIRSQQQEQGRDQSWFVAFNNDLNINCAVMVDRLAGLRSLEQLTAQADDGQPRPPFVGVHYRDENNRLWRELNLAALANESAFLKIAG
ncbi:chemotaxis protein CheW [Sphaerotilaceae bacterium SBD11-9]